MRAKKIEKLNLGFNIGDNVTVNEDHLYYSYTQFVHRYFWFASRYQYKCYINNDGLHLKVIGVYKHVMNEEYDKNKYVVVVQDKFKRIYLVGELGVKKLI
jgi:hypothetical protein